MVWGESCDSLKQMVGAKATNALSSEFYAESCIDNAVESVLFRKGQFIEFNEYMESGRPNGTKVRFYPDNTIFSTIKLDKSRLLNTLKELSFLCKDLTFEIDFEGDKHTYKSENGLLDYINFLNKDRKVISEPFHSEVLDGKTGVEVALLYNETYTDVVKLYTNNIPNTSGTHLTGCRTGLTRAINEFARDNKLLKDNEDNLTGEDLKEGQTLIINLKMVAPIFQGQNKEVLTSSEGRTIVERLVAPEIRLWLENHPQSARAIVNKALLTRKARDAARKAREAARKKATSVLGSVLPGKLADCSSKVVDDCEIYLVEGK